MKQWIQDEPKSLRRQFRAWVEANPDYTFEQTPLHRNRPTTLFEATVQPMQKHQISGVIWYQGEQNACTDVQRNWFKMCFPKLIESFRNNWKQPNLPVYHVQLPGYGNKNWPDFRELQRQYQSIPHTGIAITIDLGLADDIHPKDKSPIGKRLARLALKRHYQKHNIVDQGPQIIGLKIEGSQIHIEFDNSLTLETDKILHFEIAGEDMNFYPAQAHGSKNWITLKCEPNIKPSHLRYAWKGFPRPIQLKNREGLPTSPFILSLPKN